MDQALFDQAMTRVSQALKRTELAAERLALRSRAQPSSGDEQLRKRVTAAIGELDELIESLGR